MAIKENPSPSAHGQSILQAPPQKTNFLLLSDYNTPTQSASTVVDKIASSINSTIFLPSRVSAALLVFLDFKCNVLDKNWIRQHPEL